jgi:hypothetical protein
MTLSGEIVPALSNWQGVILIVATLLIAAGWRALRPLTDYVLSKT